MQTTGRTDRDDPSHKRDMVYYSRVQKGRTQGVQIPLKGKGRRKATMVFRLTIFRRGRRYMIEEREKVTVTVERTLIDP